MARHLPVCRDTPRYEAIRCCRKLPSMVCDPEKPAWKLAGPEELCPVRSDKVRKVRKRSCVRRPVALVFSVCSSIGRTRTSERGSAAALPKDLLLPRVRNLHHLEHLAVGAGAPHLEHVVIVVGDRDRLFDRR